MSDARVLEVPNDRTETYLQAIRREIGSHLQLIVVIFPTSRDDRYAAVKKLCCVEQPVPSQVLIRLAIVICSFISFSLLLGDQCQDNFPTTEAEKCHSEDSIADQLQARRRAVGTRDSTGMTFNC